MRARFQHDYQLAALGHIGKARELLAEAAGLLRACERDCPKEQFLPEGRLRPGEQANKVEEAESQLAHIVLLINKAPAGKCSWVKEGF